jgi:excisionase family DNA binding protein
MPGNIDLTRTYLTTSEAAAISQLSKAYLTILLKRGVLEGFQMSRDWLIYADSLEKFLATPRKPGPKGPRKKSAQAHPVAPADAHHANGSGLD